jgi:DNA-binding PadR family transcriptional regulator
MSNSTNEIVISKYNDLKKNHKLFRIPILYFLKTLYYNKQEGISFVDLKSICGFKDGDLSKITYLLDSFELIDISKTFEVESKRSRTIYKITDRGIMFIEQFSADIIDTLLVTNKKKEEEKEDG